MTDDAPELLRDFIAAVHDLWRKGLTEEERWGEVATLLPMLLDSPQIQTLAKSWPAPPIGHKRPQNLLFYEDPTHGFVINGLIKRPSDATPIHDHAHTWTVYGVLEGEERVVRYRRDEGAAADRTALIEDGEYRVGPGFVDIVPPGLIYAEYAGPTRTVALIIRSERVGGFLQNHFDLATGKTTQAPGPEQVLYVL